MYARIKSYAKINLSLDILGKSGGYHMIESAVATVNLYDLITAKRRTDGKISVTMHGEGSEAIAPENNNAIKAAECFIKNFHCGGADITIYKNIPQGAGLGGSSADICGVIRAMAKLYGAEDDAALKALADSLGSDCGCMMRGGYAVISGRGDKVAPIDCKMKMHIGLLIPAGGVSTAECYALSDTLGQNAPTTGAMKAALESADLYGLGKNLSNGLYPAAKAINGGVYEAFEELEEFAPVGVNMTGSGSGVYAIFENAEFLTYAKSRYKGRHRFIMIETVIPE